MEIISKRRTTKGKDSKRWYATYQCQCGASFEARHDLRSRLKSCYPCGRMANKTHGMMGTPLYGVWLAMKQRCDNPKNKNFHNYGGRGISYDQRWKSFETFYVDVKDLWVRGLEIDRINNDKGYSKENCRWANRKIQSRNKRNNVLISFNKKTYIMADFARLIGRTPSVVRYHLNKGRTPYEITNKYANNN